MKRVAIPAVIASVALASCGGGSGGKSSTPSPSPRQSSHGGVVTAEPTKGFLGPAQTVTPQGTKTIGRPGPISPKENRPTDAERNGVAGGAVCASTSANPVNSNLGAMSQAILCLLNQERAAHGLRSVRSNGALGSAARTWAHQMVAQRFFAHEAGSSTPLSRIKRTGYIRGNWSIGENIAWGSGALATPRAIVNGWMHSPGHRANILHGAFRDIGIGIRIGAPGANLSGGAVYVTDFGKRG